MKLFNKYYEIISYLIFGFLTTLISIFVRIVLLKLLSSNSALEVQFATIISNVVGIVFAYFTNRKYVFKSSNKNKINEGTKFILSRFISLLTDMIIMHVFITILNKDKNIVILTSQIFIVIENYLFSKLLVFNKK